ncbi:hypothetical protein [Pedobacter sp. ASV28]|uniref:hypothetical protein n=1 Tax=Pedobacter sp. ASV28 TaxID=2795123 RepID=UPI0018EC6898|nr:hypothetical protein [Pedobacter sp. ASV28]
MSFTETTTNGIEFTENIVSSKGAEFVLFPTKAHTAEMIRAAKQELRNSRDVVRLRMATAADRDEMYRSEIFAHPATKAFKWYEINDDADLITRERKKGTPIIGYINTYVIPYAIEMRSKNLQKFGEKIINF